MNKCKKFICVSIGLICFTLGAIGIVLPILPTTPFLLLASFFFVKGSERFDLWFKNTKIYKKHLDSFVKEKAMTLKQKMTILLFADFMMAFPLIILDSLVIKSMIVLMIIIKYYYFLFVIKTINN
ncbi:YbaN family protein [Clostridium sp. UBA7503]|uniref:YbaN family protein n=1 Tax=Clostridium sp. UBA7503 TaxID=1946377 RepID=UPI00321769BF